VLAHGPGLLPAGLTGKRQGGERGHMGPWPQPRGQGPLWDFFLKEAARRHDSGLLKFRTPTEIQVPLLSGSGRRQSVPGRPTAAAFCWDVPPEIENVGRPSHPPSKVRDGGWGLYWASLNSSYGSCFKYLYE
jgi:hypothetical protein